MKIDFNKLKNNIDPRIDLIKRFKELVEREGWTQGQVSEAMHISRSTVNRWFNQGRLPNQKDREMINQILAKYKKEK
ncbi:MAG: helix-turn-helix transcriptional regulator [Candidatus Ancaeobacter aquaticus]|nr:helix-turn-helix transcriptional regulator [Candidatus Ancaeobacter aquaticus]